MVFIFFYIQIATVYSKNTVQDSLIFELGKTQIPKEKIDIYLQLAHHYFRENPSLADKYVSQAILLSLKSADTDAFFKACSEKGNLNRIAGNHQLNIDFADSLLSLNQVFENSNLLAGAYNLLGLGQFGLSEYHKAETSFKNAVEAIGVANTDFLVVLTNNLGMCYYNQGNYPLCLETRMKLLDLIPEDNISSRARAYNNIASVHEMLGNYQTSLDYYEKSLQLHRESGNERFISGTLTNIGVVHYNLENFEGSLDKYSEALEMAERVGDKGTLSIILENIGNAYKKLETFELALAYFNKGIENAKAVSNKYGMANINNNIGETYLLMGNHRIALQYLFEAKELAEQIGNKINILFSHKHLSDTYKGLRDFEKALYHLAEYNVLRESMFNEEKNRQIQELETKYQTAQREAEILQLAQEKNLQEAKILQQELWIGIGSITLILALSFIFALIYVFRHRAKTKEILVAKEREIEKIKSRFFSNITHEFRTPLTLILGPIRGLIENAASTKHAGQYSIIERNANKLLQLVNELMELSKLEDGKIKLKVRKTDLLTFVKPIFGAYESWAAYKNISIQTILPDTSCTVYLDREKTEKIINNLISNALKFTPKGGEVTLSLEEPEMDPGKTNYFAIKVADNGKGIPDEQLHKIFDRHFVLEDNVAGEQVIHSNSGIGLALAKELIQIAKGKIAVDSKVGKGTCFTVWFPMDKKVFSEEEIFVEQDFYRENEEPPTSIYLNQPNKKSESHSPTYTSEDRDLVLIVEDNLDLQHYMKGMLQESYQLIFASNGKEGLQRAEKHIPDLVISDIMMPQMDGLSFTALLKENEKTSHIPVILLTAKADLENKMEGLKTGADDYLTKPFEPKELLARMENLLEQRKKLRKLFAKSYSIHPSEVMVNSRDKKFLDKVFEAIEENLSVTDFNVSELAEGVNMSRIQLYRKLKALTDLPANEVIRNYRLKRGRQLLEQNMGNIAEISFEVGFNKPAYFSECFKKLFNKTPKEYQKEIRDKK
ncbi:MAG: tetratricopeptide repeat protein [Anditalea sp.]